MTTCRRPRRAAPVPHATLLAVYDLTLAALAVLVATDGLNRFGLASPVWLLVYGLALVRIALAWRAFFDVAVRNLVYFLYPVVCVASTLWSFAPATTLVAGVQVMMTVVIAMVIGFTLSLRMICLVQFAATGLTIGLSMVNWATGLFGTVYNTGGGLLGIFTQKHMLAQRSLFTAVASLAIIAMPPARGNAAWKIAALLALPVILSAVWLSKAATSIMLTPVFMGLFVLMCVHLLPPFLTVLALCAGVLVAALLPFTLAVLNVDPVRAVLTFFDKDPTLTGRTELWTIAGQVMADHGLLGVGFKAFWDAPQFATYSLLAKQIGGETVNSFHNFVLETLVANGILGFLAMAALIAATAWRTGVLFVRTRSVMAAYALTLTLAATGLALVGSSMQRQHEGMLMFVVMVGVAAGRALAARQGAPRQPAVAARALGRPAG